MAAEPLAGKTEPDGFGVLGPLEVVRCGRAAPLGGPRQRAVLALLLLEANRVVSLDRLGQDVWGGDPPEGWVSTLQTYVFHLRQALEPNRVRGAAGGVLMTSGGGYLLRVDRDRLDAARFQDGFTAARTALCLWRGPVLADLADYAFTRPEAARLEELRLAAVEARIDADLALGRHDQLTGELERLADKHPLRERLHGQLMLALYRSGRQADALGAYQRARNLLTGELGIDPAEPLRRLHASILAHDPALDWNGGGQDPADGHRTGAGVLSLNGPAEKLFLAAAEPQPGAVTGSPYRGLAAFGEQDAGWFFGREAATTQVLDRMSRRLEGTGLLVVSGASGAGKSSLLRAGVLPRIREAGLPAAPGAASWPCVLFTPTRAPLDELALRVALLAGTDASAVRRGLETDPAGFALT